MICPKCKKRNTDNWPITVNGKIVDGGCQKCWEKESDDAWWKTVITVIAERRKKK